MKPIIKAYMTVYGVSEDEAWTAYESMSPAQYHEVMKMYNSGYTAQQPTEAPAELAAMEAERTTPAPDPDAVTLAPADAACVWTEDGETVATAAEAATVAGIIRRQGGYRERDLLKHPHTMTHGETWNAAHKVVNVLEINPDPDGYRAECAVDIVTRSIVG